MSRTWFLRAIPRVLRTLDAHRIAWTEWPKIFLSFGVTRGAHRKVFVIAGSSRKRQWVTTIINSLNPEHPPNNPNVITLICDVTKLEGPCRVPKCSDSKCRLSSCCNLLLTRFLMKKGAMCSLVSSLDSCVALQG